MMQRGPLASGLAWWALCALIGAACLIAWLLPVDTQLALRWQASRWVAQPWTLWTAALSHVNAAHLSVNLLSLLCLCILGARLGAGAREAVALLIAWPLTHLALLLWPAVQLYAGLSGLNHALGGILIAQGAMNFIVNKRFQMIGPLLALLVIIKLLWESAWSQPLRMDASWGFNVVQAAHLSGFAAGLVAACLIYLAERILLTKAVVE
jgi:rhomboid family GlyGly-CTERM serine protease